MVGRQLAGKLNEDDVVEDDVGGDILLRRQTGAFGAQGVKDELLVLAQGEVGAPPWRFFARRLFDAAGEGDGFIAAQDAQPFFRKSQAAVFNVGDEQSGGDDLPPQSLPFRRRQGGADAKGGERVVPQTGDFFR